VAVREWQDQVVFLHKIVPGAADKSYGIHVAQLAGVPRPVIERAKEILMGLESAHLGTSKTLAGPTREVTTGDGRAIQLTFFEPLEHPLVEELRELDLNRLTPLEAFEKIRKWHEQFRGRSRRAGRKAAQ